MPAYGRNQIRISIYIKANLCKTDISRPLR
jgi:hypothetical protein